jgi:hypothetical protein
MLRNLIVSLFTLFQITNSQLLGSHHDSHECVLDGGYQWCPTLNQCVRPWMTPCPPVERHPVDPILKNVGESCGGFAPQMNQCSADLECVSTMGPYVADAPGKCLPKCSLLRDDWGNCIPKDCLTWFDGCNECQIKGNQKTCTEIQCLQPTKAVCKQKKETMIPKECVSWFDGCNRCMVNNGKLGGCTKMYCFTNQDDPHCMSYSIGNTPSKPDVLGTRCSTAGGFRRDPPSDCAAGLTCKITDKGRTPGHPDYEYICVSTSAPQKLTGPLKVGEVCSRFCEDNSELSVSKANLCPKGTLCQSTTPSMVSFDTCNNRAYRCVIQNH